MLYALLYTLRRLYTSRQIPDRDRGVRVSDERSSSSVGGVEPRSHVEVEA